MALLSFPFAKRKSDLFGIIYYPVAKVSFWSWKISGWVEVVMIVDSGADYTILPRYMAQDLGVDLKKDCFRYETAGIGGSEVVYILKNARVRLGKWQRYIPIGFLYRDDVPPLLGRHKFMESFRVLFSRHTTYFSPPTR